MLGALLLRLAMLGLGGLLFSILWSWASFTFNRKKNLIHVPGPTPLPLLGNALLFMKPHEFFMDTIRQLFKEHGKNIRIHLGTRPNLVICTAEAYEKVLSSNVHITKGLDYVFLWEWLGLGLLTSTGSKWHSRRKMLTPAFHFKILEDFLSVMNSQTEVFTSILEKKVDTGNFNIFPLVTHCALDIICETAMGRNINAQENSDTEYVRAVYKSSEVVFVRQKSPWLWNNTLFKLTPLGWEWKRCLKVLHGFTNQVIRERKVELLEEGDEEVEATNESGQKRKVAFLDLLIRASKGGTVLSDEDIREEVDTFMFEGHDTTATNITFTLYLMAANPEIQANCQKELDEIFMGSDRASTSADLANMKYLESCLKESLRMYQSVPIMARTTAEPMMIDGYEIPPRTNIILANFLLHRDPEVFPDPDKFSPERFSLENTQKRNPYAYVPFSAGPRNCIGQKFAMMEEKVVVSSILRKFNLRTDLKPEDIPLLAEVILRPKNGIDISIQKRT